MQVRTLALKLLHLYYCQWRIEDEASFCQTVKRMSFSQKKVVRRLIPAKIHS